MYHVNYYLQALLTVYEEPLEKKELTQTSAQKRAILKFSENSELEQKFKAK